MASSQRSHRAPVRHPPHLRLFPRPHGQQSSHCSGANQRLLREVTESMTTPSAIRMAIFRPEFLRRRAEHSRKRR